jgi:hydroxyacylglutathione hydrolase
VESNGIRDKNVMLRQAVVGPWGLNAYALICPNTRESLLIDPGADPPALQLLLDESKPKGIIITHGHPDHIGTLDHMRRLLQVPVMAHACENPDENSVQADIGLEDGERIPLGTFMLRVYHAPGHTPDQICLGVEGDHRRIVGDTIFEGGPGKTWSPEDFRQTLRTLRQVVMPWPDETICYPGHGPCFCLGDQRRIIETFLDKDHGSFFGDAEWDM